MEKYNVIYITEIGRSVLENQSQLAFSKKRPLLRAFFFFYLKYIYTEIQVFG